MTADAPATKYAVTDAGHVAYQVFGDGPVAILFISSWMTNLDVLWDAPGAAAYLRRLASFARVVCFDKRGSGVSDPVPLDDPPTLERWMEDAVAALDAAGADRVAVIGDTEGGPMAILLAATFPERVTALVLVNSFARWQRTGDYPIGMPPATTEKLIARWRDNWGFTAEILGLTAPSWADDEHLRRWFLRYQRLAMPPGAAQVMYRWVLSVDVRDVLSNVAAPTLVVHRRDARHHRVDFGRYLAEHIPGARLVELDGADTLPFHAGDVERLLSHIEVFLTGSEHPVSSGRRLATVLMTDVVGSTAMAARMGDDGWRTLLREHDSTVRDALQRFRGEQIAHTGDGMVASFDGPTRAVRCAQHLSAVLPSRASPSAPGCTPARSRPAQTARSGLPSIWPPGSWRSPATVGSWCPAPWWTSPTAPRSRTRRWASIHCAGCRAGGRCSAFRCRDPAVHEAGSVTTPRPLLLVDAPSLYFRAYFGVPEDAARAPDGSPVNAVRGFVDMLATLIDRRRPDRVVCAFDADWRPAWRVALLPSYKAHRVATPVGDEIVPDPLAAQVPLIIEVLAAVGIAAAGADGFEADDVLGTLATTEPGPIEVASGDRDLFQLVDDAKPVRLLYCGRGVARLEVCDDADVRERFGVPAAGYADFATLRGDPSDGLPGVRGVGAKTAADLIRRYGDLEHVVRAADAPGELPARLRAALIDAGDYLRAAPAVVRVVRDVPLPPLETALPLAPIDPERVLELADRWNLAASLRRLVDAVARTG